MSIVNRIRNAITGGEWFVAYRNKDTEEWKIADAPANQWCADPFVFEDADDCYIFVEQYLKDKDKGCIGYYKFIDGIPVNQGIVIENGYHMSYPDVFCYNNTYYMIPESSANNTVDLYMAERFPDKWKKVKTLIRDEKYVDSTFFSDNSGCYLLAYKLSNYEVHVFSLDLEKRTVELISKKRYKQNIGRPGGRLFVEDGRLMRPAQDCSKKYGEELIIYQVDELNRDGRLLEHEVRRINAGDLRIEKKPDRVHQFTRVNNYNVIDVYKEHFDLFHGIKIILRARRK